MAASYGLTQFEWDEERDLKSYPLWICCLHTAPIVAPVYAWAFCDQCAHGMQYAAEMLCVPTTKGWDWRIVDGYPYLTTILLCDQERQEREPKFRENLTPFI